MKSKADFSPQKLFLILFFVFLAIDIGILIYTVTSIDSVNAQIADNKIVVADLEKELASVQDSKSLTEEQVSKTLHSATDAGRAVASAQSEYLKLNSNDSNFKEKRTEIKDSITQYFSDEEEGYASCWYTINQPECEWEFLSTYSFDSEELNVLWLCKNKKDAVVAFTTATYNTTSNQFTHVNSTFTNDGLTGFADTNPLDGVDTDNINDLVEKMK